MPKMHTKRKCIVCGKVKLLPRSAKYCSDKCRKNAQIKKRSTNRDERLKRKRENFKKRKLGIDNRYIMKPCANCGKVVKMYASGQTKYCDDCRPLTGKIYRSKNPGSRKKEYERNKSWYNEYSKKYYKINKDLINKKQHEYYENNRERIILKNREYTLEHYDEKIQYHRNYHKKNWEWMREKYKAKRDAYRKTKEFKLIMAVTRQNRRMNGWKKLTVDELKRIEQKNIKKFGELTCCYCKTPFRKLLHITKVIQIEHLTPLNRGGQHTVRNLDFACIYCNSYKGTMKKSEFLSSDRFKESVKTVRRKIKERNA